MPRKWTEPTGPPPKYRVGDKVRFRHGRIVIVGEVSEDRGLIGDKGRRMYGIRFSRPYWDSTYTERGEEDIEPAT
jgi:hypothetical protein